MAESEGLNNLPVKVAGMNEPERVYRALERPMGRGAAAYLAEPARDKGEFSLRDILYVLFRHKGKIVFIFLLLAGATMAYVASIPQLFESEARVFIRDDRTGVTVDPTGEGNAFLKGSRDSSSVRTEMGILTSQMLAEQVVERLGPDVVLGLAPGVKAPPASRPPPNHIAWVGPALAWVGQAGRNMMERLNLGKPHLTPREMATQAIVAGLDVGPTASESAVLRVNYRAPSPQAARDVLNALVDAYQQQNILIHQAQVSPEFFQGKLKTLRGQLTEKENQLEAERKRLNVSSLENQKSMLLNQFNTYDMAIKENAMRMTGLKAKIIQFEQLASRQARTPAGKRIETPQLNPALEQFRSRLIELRLKESELSRRFTDKHSELIDVRDQIAQLEKMMRGEAADGKGGGLGAIAQVAGPPPELQVQEVLAKAELDQESVREGMLIKAMDKVRQDLATLQANEKMLKQLERDVELLETEYRQYLKSMQISDISRELDRGKISNVSVVQRASLPTEPVKSQRKLLALLGFGIFLSLMTGVGWAFGLEYCDHSVKTNEDVERQLGLPVLVALPLSRHHQPLLEEGKP